MSVYEKIQFPHCKYVGKSSVKGKHDLLCNCGKSFTLSGGTMTTARKNSNNIEYLGTVHCGCIEIERVLEEEANCKKIFFEKDLIRSENKKWCSYCESYRCKSLFNGHDKKYCDNCRVISSRKYVMYETFDEIMERWDSRSHTSKYKRLPYLKGNSRKGFQVRGFTYVDRDWYEPCSKWLWVKCKDYIKMALSKDNLERNGLLNLHSIGNYLFLHRFIKGLSNSNKDYVSDHINGKSLDNRSENLRVATILENTLNSRKVNNKKSSRYKGVSFSKTKYENGYRYWKAQVAGYKQRFFYSETDAAKCYDQLLREYYPDKINRYNFPKEGELSAI